MLFRSAPGTTHTAPAPFVRHRGGVLCGSAAEWCLAHRRLDTADEQLLELLRTGEGTVGGEVPGVVAHGGHPGSAAVVVLAPGDRVEVAVSGVAHRSGGALGEAVLVDGRQEPDLRRERHQVVPLVAEGPTVWQASRRHVLVFKDVDDPGLVVAVVVVVRTSEQALVPRPVVLGAER